MTFAYHYHLVSGALGGNYVNSPGSNKPVLLALVSKPNLFSVGPWVFYAFIKCRFCDSAVEIWLLRPLQLWTDKRVKMKIENKYSDAQVSQNLMMKTMHKIMNINQTGNSTPFDLGTFFLLEIVGFMCHQLVWILQWTFCYCLMKWSLRTLCVLLMHMLSIYFVVPMLRLPHLFTVGRTIQSPN